MKLRIGIVTILLALLLFPVFAIQIGEDVRALSLGSDINFFNNPAAIYYYNQRKSFLFQSAYSDVHNTDSNYFIDHPELYLRGQFVGNGIAFSFGADSYVTDYTEVSNKKRNINHERRYDLGVSFAYGIKGLSVGASVYGGSFAKKSNIGIDKSKNFTQLVSKSYFAQHTRVRDSEFANIKLGVMYNYKGCTVSVKSDELLSFKGKQESLTFNNALESIDVGFYFNQEKYKKRGRLKTWVLSFGVEGNNIIDGDNASLNSSVELMFQLAKDYSVSFICGYEAYFSNLDDGSAKAGFDFRVGKIDVCATGNIPLDVFDGEDENYKMGIDFTFLI